MRFCGTLSLIGFLLVGCGSDAPRETEVGENVGETSDTDTDSTADTPPEQTLAFENVALFAGLDTVQNDPDTCTSSEVLESVVGCYAEGWSGGVAVGDFDGDGFEDLYFTSIDGRDALYRNEGDGTFTDIAADVGLVVEERTNGAAFADIDRDGDLDLAVTVLGGRRHLLFINEGGMFSEESEQRGLDGVAGIQFGTTPAFGDYDRDGYPDLFIANQSLPRSEPPLEPASSGQLYRNRGAAAPGSFENVTESSGVGDVPRGFSPSFVDLDLDGWPDLQVVANDEASRIFWNDNGFFTDGTEAAGVGTSGAEMGSTFGDFDQDGDLDWFVAGAQCPTAECGTNREFDYANANRLYENLGDRTFADRTEDAGMRVGYLGWGSAFFDYDNDGDLDLVQTNGWAASARYDNEPSFYAEAPTRFWRNDGEYPWPEAAEEVGLDFLDNGHGLAVFDYEQDGDLDIVVVVSEGEPLLLRSIMGGDYLRVRLADGAGIYEGSGAVVTMYQGGANPPQMQVIGAISHYLGQSERVAHFGLTADDGAIERVTIRWPRSGEITELTNVERNQAITVIAPAAEAPER